VTYTKLMWKRHHVRNRDLQRKLMLKWAAISALPSVEMKKEALVIDPFVPMWSRVPAATPPVKGFHGETTTAEAATPDADTSKAAGATGAKKDDKKKSVAQASLAAAVRRGRGREEDDESSLFGIATDEKTALHAPVAPVSAAPEVPVAAAPAAKGKGKKK
jgi:hypothetical protein